MARDVGLFYSRDLVGNDVIELFLTIYNHSVLSWSPLPANWQQALQYGTSALNAVQNIRALLAGEVPDFLDIDGILTMIPLEIVPGFAVPKYQPGSSVVEFWYPEKRYLFVESVCYPVVFPQFAGSFLPPSLSGSAVFGVALTYRSVDVAYTPDPIQETVYNAPYIHRDSGLSVYTPLQWSDSWKPVAQRSVRSVGGYWEIYRTWVITGYLWIYPPVENYWDMRLLNSHERLEVAGGFWQMDIIDEIADALPAASFSWLPSPSAYGTRRLTGVPDYACDEVRVKSSALPVRIFPPELRQRGKSGGGVGGRVARLIQVILPHLGGGGGIGGRVTPRISSGLAGLPLTIAEKLLEVNGFVLNIRSDE